MTGNRTPAAVSDAVQETRTPIRAGSHVLQWHITHRCNMRCQHCYQDEFQSEMNRDELLAVLIYSPPHDSSSSGGSGCSSCSSCLSCSSGSSCGGGSSF